MKRYPKTAKDRTWSRWNRHSREKFLSWDTPLSLTSPFGAIAPIGMNPVTRSFIEDLGALPQPAANLDRPIVSLVQLAALGVIVVVVAWVLYEVLRLRGAYTEQKTLFVRAVSIVNRSQQLHSQMISLLQRLESVLMSGEAQKVDLKQLDERIGAREEQLAQSLGRLPELVEGLAPSIPEAGRKPNDSAVMRKGILSQDPKLRFSVLKDWTEKNSLAILRRAHEWKTADDLIAMIPSALEPEAEILDDRVLLLGTRGHPDKVAIGIRDPSSTNAESFFSHFNPSMTTSVVPSFQGRLKR